MAKLPEGRKPLPDEWFNKWPNVDDFSDIRPMTDEERNRAKEKEKGNREGP